LEGYIFLSSVSFHFQWGTKIRRAQLTQQRKEITATKCRRIVRFSLLFPFLFSFTTSEKWCVDLGPIYITTGFNRYPPQHKKKKIVFGSLLGVNKCDIA
jgi:hypothetical protein